MTQLTMVKAVNQALDQELKRDPKVLVFGEDVGKMVGFSVQLMDYRQMLVKIKYLIPHLQNQQLLG